MEKNLDGRIQSVDRAMTLLEVLAKAEQGYRLSDLARDSGLSVTTTHRLLTTLQQRKFVQFSKSDTVWHIGVGAYVVGSAFTQTSNVVASAAPFLRRLRDQTSETANIGIAQDGQVMLVGQMARRDAGRALSAVGAKTPMTASGMGKVLLSSYRKDEVAAIVSRRGMTRMTRKTLGSLDALETQLRQVAVDGYSIDDEEYETGLRCIAAPIYNHVRDVVCAISISGSSTRITTTRLPELADLVKSAAADFSATMGNCHGS